MSDPTGGDRPVRVGVVGVGSMGENHARVYRDLPGVRLVGVTDHDEARATAVAGRTGTEATDRASLFEAADAVSIATPTRTHAGVVEAAIDGGLHVLVEKPFVSEPAEGRALVDRAAARGVTLQVGHVERFNPALDAARRVLADRRPIAVDARRLGPPPERSVTEDAVFDLMVHDIDVVLSLTEEPVERVAAAASPDGQYVDATLQFADELVAGLTASRVTQRPVRELSVTTTEIHVEVDYLEQTVAVHRGRSEGSTERVVTYPDVERGEPLRRELAAFVETIHTGGTPAVDGTAGVETVELARRVREAAGTATAVVAR